MGNGSHHEETNSQFHFPAALPSAKGAVPINRNLDGSENLLGHEEEKKILACVGIGCQPCRPYLVAVESELPS